ncbi:ISAzo13-like element transposase-related protein [Frankia sp. CcWB3]
MPARGQAKPARHATDRPDQARSNQSGSSTRARRRHTARPDKPTQPDHSAQPSQPATATPKAAPSARALNVYLVVRCALDPADYPTGIKLSKKEQEEIPFERDSFHGEWNYTFTSRRPDIE